MDPESSAPDEAPRPPRELSRAEAAARAGRRALTVALQALGLAWRALSRVLAPLGRWLGRQPPVRGARRVMRLRRSRRLAARLAVWSIYALIGWTAFAAFIAYGLPVVTTMGDARDWRAFERAASRARGVTLMDARGRYVGIISSAFEPDVVTRLPRSERFGGLMLFPDHKTAPLEDAPPLFWRCLVYLEDRHRGTWRNPHGVDFIGVWRIPFSAALLSARRLKLSAPAGGSTLEMQIARSMWKRYAHNSNMALRKLQEWRAAPVIKRHLVTKGDDRRLRAWAAQHIALAQGVGGAHDVHGVEAAARFLFGKPAAQLDPAEQLVLAAAAKRPLRMRKDQVERQAELKRVIERRAILCADPARRLWGAPVIPDDAERQATLARLLELARTPYQGPYVDPDFAPFIQFLVEHKDGPRLDPQRVAANLAFGVQREVVAEFADLFAPGADGKSHPWRGRMAWVELTLDVAKNAAFRDRADEAILRIEREAAGSSPPRLAPGALAAPSRAGSDIAGDPDLRRTPLIQRLGARVPILAAAANERGEIVRFLNTGEDSAYMGGVAQRPDVGPFGDGPYQPARETRVIASLGKAAAALLLAEAGEGDAGRAVPNVCQPGVRENCMSPATGRGGRPKVALRKAFAESLNAAVIGVVAERVPDARIDAFMTGLGFYLPQPQRGEPPATSLALGRYVGRPRAIQTMMAAALAYAREDFDADIALPHFVDLVRSFDPAADRFATAGVEAFPARALKLAELVAPGPDRAAAGRFVREALSAPMCFEDAENRASLRRLRDWCAARNPAVRMHLAKTGTLSTGRSIGGYNEAGWWIAGAIEFKDGRRYSYVVSAGVADPSAPFARDLGGGRLAPLVSALLEDLAGDAGPGGAASGD